MWKVKYGILNAVGQMWQVQGWVWKDKIWKGQVGWRCKFERGQVLCWILNAVKSNVARLNVEKSNVKWLSRKVECIMVRCRKVKCSFLNAVIHIVKDRIWIVMKFECVNLNAYRVHVVF